MSTTGMNPNEDFSENQQRGDEDLPGYPHYPSSEDITHPSNGVKKVTLDPDEISRGQNPSEIPNEERTDKGTMGNMIDEEEDELLIVPGTEADVTKEDLALLGPRDEDLDLNDDELIRGKDRLDKLEDEEIDRTALGDEDLDIPGTELDDSNEVIGEEDEENNYYSLGGDRHENLDEDNQQEPESDNI